MKHHASRSECCNPPKAICFSDISEYLTALLLVCTTGKLTMIYQEGGMNSDFPGPVHQQTRAGLISVPR